MTHERADWLLGALTVSALIWLLLVSTDAIGPRGFVPLSFMALANVAQVVIAALAAGLAVAIYRCLDFENPVRGAWRLIALGLAAFAVGETGDAWYEVLAGVNRPFPSVLDGVFIAAYVLLWLAFLAFVRTYSRSRLVGGNMHGHRRAAAAFAVLLALAGFVMIEPLLEGGGSHLERVLSAAYPTLDLLALLPAFVLVRLTVVFRGGGLWNVWASILAGFGFTCAADFLFAHFTVRGIEGYDALMEALYLLSYVAFARGAHVQRGLLGLSGPSGPPRPHKPFFGKAPSKPHSTGAVTSWWARGATTGAALRQP